MKFRFMIAAALLMFCCNLLFAQNVKFTASVNKTQVGTGEPFEITFSVNGSAESFSPPDFGSLQLLSGPNQSQSMTSINGNTTVSLSYSYDLVAVKEGIVTIGAAYMVVNGKRLSSNPIRITVVKGQPVQQNRQQQGAEETLPRANTSDLSKLLFLKSDVDKTSVYQGEQLVLSYRLYTRAGIVDSRLDKLPDLNGFWAQDIKTRQQQVQWRQVMYKGEKYNVADVKQTILFPEHSGDITINPFEMTFIVRVPAAPSDDIMEQFFGSVKDVKYTVKSKPVIIHVKPLPENGKPAGYTGAVGRFTLETRVDKTELNANEALNYTVKINGSGNIKLLKDPGAQFPLDFEKYDPKLLDTVMENQNGVYGNRTYNYLLIPRHQGDFKIEPVQFSYFNPATQKYTTLYGKQFRIKVNRGKTEENVTALPGNSKQDIQVLDKDIRYIKSGDPQLSREGEDFYGSALYVCLLLLGPGLCIAAFIYRNQQRKLNSDQKALKKRRAGKVAARHLAHAQQQLTAQNSKEFYEAVFKGLYGYLGDKLSLSAADMNKETIVSALKDRSVNDHLTSQLLETLDLCEMARYAPLTHISEQEVLEKAKDIINDIDHEIK